MEFWNLGVGVTWGWKSLHRELPGTEDPKTRSVKPLKSLPGLATAVLWAQGKRGWKFGSRELKKEASARTSGDQKPQNPKH
jgi:hypothetical protein